MSSEIFNSEYSWLYNIPFIRLLKYPSYLAFSILYFFRCSSWSSPSVATGSITSPSGINISIPYFISSPVAENILGYFFPPISISSAFAPLIVKLVYAGNVMPVAKIGVIFSLSSSLIISISYVSTGLTSFGGSSSSSGLYVISSTTLGLLSVDFEITISGVSKYFYILINWFALNYSSDIGGTVASRLSIIFTPGILSLFINIDPTFALLNKV